MANTLFIRLEGPLQSWGERARWSVRDSAPEPTKSGVVGLLACALGMSRDEELRELSRRICIGVRCDRPGVLLVDYHTVVGGVLSAEGKVKINAKTREPETVVSWRHYLCDASFLVAVQSDDEDLILSLAEAIQEPCWPFFMGRKSCPPALPPFLGTGNYDSLEDGLENAFPVKRSGDIENGEVVQVRAVLECSSAEGVRRRDEIDSRKMRTFLPRFVREVFLTIPVESEADHVPGANPP